MAPGEAGVGGPGLAGHRADEGPLLLQAVEGGRLLEEGSVEEGLGFGEGEGLRWWVIR